MVLDTCRKLLVHLWFKTWKHEWIHRRYTSLGSLNLKCINWHRYMLVKLKYSSYDRLL